MKTDLKILPAGDSAVVAEFGNTIDPLINDLVQAMTARIHRDRKSTRLNSSHLKLSRMPSSA